MRINWRILVPVGVLIVLVSYIITAWAVASFSSDKRWHKPVVTIYDGTDRPVSMKIAADKWNQVGLPLKLVLTHDRSKADVIASSTTHFVKGCTSAITVGCATVGARSKHEKPILQLIRLKEGETDDGSFANVAAHEMGHILGEDHNTRRCSLLNETVSCPQAKKLVIAYQADCPMPSALASLQKFYCPRSETNQFLCGPTRKDAMHALRAYSPSARIRAGYNPVCALKKKFVWEAWCAFPHALPIGQKRPSYVVYDLRYGWHCNGHVTTRALAVLQVLKGQVEKKLAKALTARRNNPVEKNAPLSPKLRQLIWTTNKISVNLRLTYQLWRSTNQLTSLPPRSS